MITAKCCRGISRLQVMFFYRNKHMMIDLGTGNNNKINWPMNNKQEYPFACYLEQRSERERSHPADSIQSPHAIESGGNLILFSHPDYWESK